MPLTGEVVLSTRRLLGIEDGDADAGQLTAAAGTTLAEVQRAAAALGWRYGIDLAAHGESAYDLHSGTSGGGTGILAASTTSTSSTEGANA